MSIVSQTEIRTFWPQLITVATGPTLQILWGSEITLNEERSTPWIASKIATSRNSAIRTTKLLNSNDGIVTADEALSAAIEHGTPLNPLTQMPYSMPSNNIEWGKIIQSTYKKHWNKDITSTTGEKFRLVRDGIQVSPYIQNLDSVIEATRSCDGHVYTLIEYDPSERPMRVTGLEKRFLEYRDLQGLQPEDE